MSFKSSRPARIAAILFSFLLFSGCAVAVAGADDPSRDAEASGSESAARVEELPARATTTSNTYLLDNGSLETELFEVPVNYRDETGDWKAIDEGLTELPSGAVTNGANSFDIHLPEDLNDSPIRVSLGEEWVSQMPVGVQASSVDLGQDGIASYEAERESADFEFAGLASGLKESIELSDPSAPSTYRFRMEASAGLTPNLAADGSISFHNEDGQLVAEMPAPFMVDDAGIQAPPDAVGYALTEDRESGWALSVEADPEWLGEDDRSWPVVIDPSVLIPSPASNCLIATTTNATMCGETDFAYLTAKAKYPSTGSDSFARTLLRYSLTSIPAGASMTAATIGLYSVKTATNVTKVDLYDVNQGWTEAATWTSTGATNWISPGGDFGQNMPNPASVSTAQRGSQPGWWEFSSPDLPWLVQRWKDGVKPNRGVLLKLANETPRVCCFERRVEWESSAGANKPKLSVQYIQAAPSDSKITSPTDGTAAAKRFVLRSAWDHSNVEGVKYQYRLAPPKPKTGETAVPIAPWGDIPAAQVINSEKQSVAWPIGVNIDDRSTGPLYWDASSLTSTNPSVRLQIRAVLSGSPGASGYTKPVEVELNRTAGGSKDAETPIGPGSVNLLTGNFTISRTDVSVPGYGSPLAFSRSISSAEAATEPTGVLGPGWQPSTPVEQAGGSAWQKLKVESKTEVFEGISETFKWVILKHADGKELRFDENEKGEFITPPEAAGNVLYRLNASEIAFTDPDGNRTIFSNNGSGDEYLPKSVGMPGGPGNKTRMIYQFEAGKRRLQAVIAPSAPGVSCPDSTAWNTPGCRVLEFTYEPATVWGAPSSAGMRLELITYYAAGFGGPWNVAQYHYDKTGKLDAAWDPRISPALKELYSYSGSGQLAGLTPPGQEPWSFQYGTGVDASRLLSVKRASLVSSNPTAQTTIAYGVPIAGGPYEMSKQEIARWGQEDFPMDATAIFPPDEVPSTPPSSYAHAMVYYMDPEGQVTNVASPAGAGSTSARISTTETDIFGNVVRELTPANRIRALAAGSESAAESKELDTQLTYSADGTLLVDERGPLHSIRIESGEQAGALLQARSYRSIQYDVGAPEPKAGETWPLLPTYETTGALVAGKVLDQRTTKYGYRWDLRQQTEEIIDPEGLNIRRVTAYDLDTSLPTETRQPKDASSPGAGSTKITYYSAGSSPASCLQTIYAGLPCKIEPVSQPSGAPNLPITRFVSYTQLGAPTEVVEDVGSPVQESRKTLYTYDAAGRRLTKQTFGGGVTVPKVMTEYGASSGLPLAKRFVCPESEPECDRQSIIFSYDKLGRTIGYKDADDSESTITYDLDGRVATFNDGKGTQTLQYDAATSMLVGMVDSMAGTFTASYDADGNMVSRGFPNGLTATTTIDQEGEPKRLTYTKASNCGASCTWLDSEVTRSASGLILSETGTLGSDSYSYDSVGRLTKATETPSGAGCTTRVYAYDPNSNRTSKTTRSPGIGGVCTESAGSNQGYSYDSADRLVAEGLTYDKFGRISNLPASLGGGKALSTTYFSNDMVASQSQNGVTNTFQLDAMQRQRQRLQAGGLEGTEVFHYAGQGDSPAWTELGATWTRNIVGIGGELVGVQESGKELTLSLTNMHGDIVAAAAISPTATVLKGTFSYDEFGSPTSGTAGRFGWLGGLQRRTELPSGVVQMGARSYIPSIGRFLSADPIAGGSANAYDYADQDPINSIDPSGLKPYDAEQSGPCKGRMHVWSNKIRSRDGYGKFQMRYGMQCGAAGYHVRVLKIIRRFENLTRNQIELESVNEPARPGSAHYNGYWGNWDSGPATKFDCLNGQEYQYTYEIVFEYTTPVVICSAKDCASGGAEGGSLTLQAQEYCGHGPY